jgi:hypothetical protein
VATGALDSAAVAYRQAVPLAEAAVTHQEGSPKARATLASVYAGVALMHVRRASGTREARACREATTWYARAAVHWNALDSLAALTADDRTRRQRATGAVRSCPAS